MYRATSSVESLPSSDDVTLEDIEISLYSLLHHELQNQHSSEPSILFSSTDEESSNLTSSEFSKLNVDISSVVSSGKSNNINCTFKKLVQLENNVEVNQQKNSEPCLDYHTEKEFCQITQLIVAVNNNKNVNINNPKNSYHISTVINEVEDSKYEAYKKNVKRKFQKCPTSKFDIVRDKYTSVRGRVSEPDTTEDDSDDSVIILSSSSSHLSKCDELSLESNSDIEEIRNNLAIGSNTIQLNILQSSELGYLKAAVNSHSISHNYRDFVCKKWTAEMISFYEDPKPDVDLELIQQTLPDHIQWYVDKEDFQNSHHSSNRYFNRKHNMRCLKCKQTGHLTKNCSEPKKIVKCHMCGEPGHNQACCPKKLCLNCGKPCRAFVDCCPECRKEENQKCMICTAYHTTQRCPDLWRRYHLTVEETDQLTKPGNTILKPQAQLQCCNCARPGHVVTDCTIARPYRNAAHRIAVFDYENSLSFLSRLKHSGNESVVVPENRASVWVLGQHHTKTKIVKYSFNPGTKINAETIKSAKNQVLKDIKNVDICWRKQKKKNRVLVEFQGIGDKIEARKRFKKFIHCQSQSSKSSLSSVGKTQIKTVSITYTNVEQRKIKKPIPVEMSVKQKTLLGKFLAKLQNRNQVSITSCVTGDEMEIFVGYKPNFRSVVICSSIERYLNTVHNECL